MTKTKKTVMAVLALCAISATAFAATTISNGFRSTTAFADTATVTNEAPAGSEENPVKANMGVNTINEMVVSGNPEMGFKELTYYMTFTPANSGVYSFTQSNPDIGVSDIYSETDAPYGELNDDWTVFSVELIKDVEYTVIISNYDWMIDLTEAEVGSSYELADHATITVEYASKADGSTRETALEYTVGATIIVPQGHDAVWYTFEVTEATDIYVILFSGATKFYNNNSTRPTTINDYRKISASGTCYIQVTPTATAAAEVKVLNAADETDGSCIATAVALPENLVVGNGTWYKYTVGENNETLSLKPTDNAVVVEDENGSHTLCGTVAVYEGCKFIGTLSNGVFTPAVLPEVEDGQEVPTYANVELVAGKTYHFFAANYEYTGDGDVVEILSQLVIA